ncbi:putative glycoside hydrolase family 78 protein [Phaeomoniella chlamydospora]|uniref:Putative glycoside hydrolase family 78 protein n=1 Tax=Phaeomoniella chlamydospora TaxID=158046 RepID=A0A0G2DYW9_PHACM|nr:putative glycoside hydrolase family 78 protein [Phaeomoniella chlamydospora]
MTGFAFVCSVVAWLVHLVAAIPYEQYVLTPRLRTLLPTSVLNVNGTVEVPEALLSSSGVTRFQGPSAVTYDFGKNVAGIVSVNLSAVQGNDEFVGVSFTESSLWISSEGCDATADAGIDEALWFPASNGTTYTADKKHQRGGFRYLNIYHNTSGVVEVSALSIYFTAIPHKDESELGQYTGYFHSNDEQLNRVWYAGAYTNEMCSIDPTAGDSLVHLGAITSTDNISTPISWWNNYTIANGSSVLVDGAKRDRLVWPGDIAISGPSIFVSTNDLISIKNGLDSLLAQQNASGALPYAGVPFGEIIKTWSFTYHLYTLIDIYDYYLYTGDKEYLATAWPKFKLGLNYALQFIDSTGLANVTTSSDWLRFGMGAHNIEANSILYYTLNLGVTLAQISNDTSNVSTSWSNYAANIRSAANTRLWDSMANCYRDNDTLPLTDLHPQDGNSWAIISGLVSSSARALNISNALAARWGPYGAPAPEAGATISPFVSGFELQAHYLAGQPELAVKLMKLMWADFMLDDPRMTNSTFLEGYSTDGTLHYAPYNNDPRISHAHGWATGPTSTLTFYAAGLKLTSAAGKIWSVAPRLVGLTNVESGFQTSLGYYSVTATLLDSKTGDISIQISTPEGTSGSVSVPTLGLAATLTVKSTSGGCGGTTIRVPGGTPGNIEIDGLDGGDWTVTLKSS